MSCSRTQRSEAGEAETSIPLSRVKHSSHDQVTALPINMINRTQINKYMHSLKQNAVEVQKPAFLSKYDEKQGQTQNKAQTSFQSKMVLINIKRKQLRMYVVKFR